MPGREHLIRTRWSDPVLDEGFADIPKLFLDHTHELGLDAKDQIILVHLMSFLRSGTRAWPSHYTLAQLCGIPVRTLRRRLRQLELMGILAVEGRPSTQDTNVYDLGPLLRLLRKLKGPRARNGHSPLSKMATEEEARNKKQELRDFSCRKLQERRANEREDNGLSPVERGNREYVRRVHGV